MREVMVPEPSHAKSFRRQALRSAVRVEDQTVAEFLRTMDGGRQEALERFLEGEDGDKWRAIAEGADPQAALLEERQRLEAKLAAATKDILYHERMLAALEELQTWAAQPFRLELVGETILHKLSRRTILSPRVERPNAVEPEDFAKSCEVFLVQHDWARLLSKATVDHGDVRLPYERCCFEFQITGRRVCALVSCDSGLPISLVLFIKLRDGWLYGHHYTPNGDGWAAEEGSEDHLASIATTIGAQIRAIAITLDAAVTVTDVVRAPHRLNAQRIKRGDVPIFDHHVISLAPKPRAARLPSRGEPTRHVRLHFRRGHWRHYENHKTWIKWMLVGDPSLGFAAKDYAL